MSITTRTRPGYSLSCDQPGCDRRLTDEGRVIWFNPDDFELDALRADWQHDGDGRWYCPKHWRLTCHYCGADGGRRPRPAGRRRLGGRLLDRAHLPGLRRDALTRQRKDNIMGMHEFHITTYVLTCDECGTQYGGFGEYLDIPNLYQHAMNAGWQTDDDHHYYCPEHWQFNCQTCGRRYSRPNPDTKEGTRWVETHGRDCPECIRKKNLAEFEKLAKKLEE